MSQDSRDLLGAWAVGAVDDVEQQAVDRLIREDPDAAAEARELLETVGSLASAAAEDPPEDVRDRVLRGIHEVPQSQPSARVRPDSRARPVRLRRHQMRWWAAAAAILVAVAVPTGVAMQQDDRADRAEQQVEAITAALAEPGAVLVTEPVTGGGHAAMVRGDDGAVVALRDLPPLTDQDYQLWLVEGDSASSAGVISVRNGLATAEVGNAPVGAALALTIEPTGGSSQPTTDPVVVLSSS